MGGGGKVSLCRDADHHHDDDDDDAIFEAVCQEIVQHWKKKRMRFVWLLFISECIDVVRWEFAPQKYRSH